jgi:hypothetical protein
MMLENRFTGLFLLSDLSVGCTTDLIQDSAPFALFFSVSKANLDRCAFAKEGITHVQYTWPNRFIEPVRTESRRREFGDSFFIEGITT